MAEADIDKIPMGEESPSCRCFALAGKLKAAVRMRDWAGPGEKPVSSEPIVTVRHEVPVLHK